MKYKTICAARVEELDLLVQEHLDREWEVNGAPYQKDSKICQSMYYDVDDHKKEEGITSDDLATISLLRSLSAGRRGRR